MINFLTNKKFLLIIILGVFVIFLFLFFVFVQKNSVKYPAPTATPIQTPAETPFPVSSDTSINYSNLDKLIPGKSTLDDVKKLSGPPEKTTISKEETLLYYPTPLERYKNEVLLKNNIVYYVIENIFGDYRGSLSAFQNTYGGNFIKMYKKGEPFTWYVYSAQGIGVESDGTNILIIIHFAPLSEGDFIKNIAPGLGISTEIPPVSE